MAALPLQGSGAEGSVTAVNAAPSAPPMEGGNRLAGKRVLLTGTGRGQGATAQELFCRHGATVWGSDAIDGADFKVDAGWTAGTV